MDERLAQGASLLHRRDTRVKITGAFCFTLLVALTPHLSVALSALVFALALVLVGRLPFAIVAKRLLIANAFTLFLWLTLPLTYGGEVAAQWGPVRFSGEGAHLALLVTLKTNAIVMSLMALVGTSEVASIGHGLKQLGLPEKLCFLLLFSYRFIFVIHQEYTRLHRAVVMRNFRPATTLHTYKTYGYLFGMTLVKSWNRSQRVHEAMMLRGFEGKLMFLGNRVLRREDYIFLAAFLAWIPVLASFSCWL